MNGGRRYDVLVAGAGVLTLSFQRWLFERRWDPRVVTVFARRVVERLPDHGLPAVRRRDLVVNPNLRGGI